MSELRTIKRIWEKVSEKVTKRFGLEPANAPKKVKSIKNRKSDAWFGGKIRNSVLILDGYDVPLEGIIAKAQLGAVLKREGFCPQSTEDLANAFAAQNLSKHLQSDWFSVWQEVVGVMDIGKMRNYYPAEMFRLLQYLQGEEGIESMIRQFLKWKQSGLEFTNESYATYISENFRRWSRRFDATEIHLIEHLLEKPHISMKELAQHMDVSYKWVSTKKNELMDNYVLSRQDYVPYSKLGIHFVFVLIGNSEDLKDPLDLAIKSPFFISYRRILSGRWSLLVLLTIPHNKKSFRALEDFTRIVSQTGREIEVYDTAIAGYPRCYDFYSTERGKWQIPWDLLKHELLRIHTDSLADIIPRDEKPIAPTSITLDQLDMEILSGVFRGETSVRSIRESLRIGQNRAHRRLKRLKENGLIDTRWSLRHIGLNECVFLACRDTELGESISAWVQRLPYCQVQFTTEGHLILAADLPEGGAYGFTRAINSLPKSMSTGMLGHSITSRIDFPKELWNEESQSWSCPEDEIQKWFMSIT